MVPRARSWVSPPSRVVEILRLERRLSSWRDRLLGLDFDEDGDRVTIELGIFGAAGRGHRPAAPHVGVQRMGPREP